MRLRATRRMDVRIEALKLDISFAAREELRTEISAKFTRERLARDMAAAGLELREVLTDDDGLFALSLSARPAHA
jgi:L-histidine N-alpha-methyltransferase